MDNTKPKRVGRVVTAVPLVNIVVVLLLVVAVVPRVNIVVVELLRVIAVVNCKNQTSHGLTWHLPLVVGVVVHGQLAIRAGEDLVSNQYIPVVVLVTVMVVELVH